MAKTKTKKKGKTHEAEDLAEWAEAQGLESRKDENGVTTVVVPIVTDKDGKRGKDSPDLGGAILFPTDVQPHLVCARPKKNQQLQAEHGVTFRRVGDDCHVYATDRKLAFRLVLEGDGQFVPPAGAVVPRKAMQLVARAEAELVSIWFGKGKVRIRADGEQHDFRLIDVLPFPGDESEAFVGAEAAARRVNNCRISGSQLARLQKALGAEWLELVQPRRGMVIAVPGGAADADAVAAGDRLGALTLWSSIEDEKPEGEGK